MVAERGEERREQCGMKGMDGEVGKGQTNKYNPERGKMEAAEENELG